MTTALVRREAHFIAILSAPVENPTGFKIRRRGTEGWNLPTHRLVSSANRTSSHSCRARAVHAGGEPVTAASPSTAEISGRLRGLAVFNVDILQPIVSRGGTAWQSR
jgi:hypothetical protein